MLGSKLEPRFKKKNEKPSNRFFPFLSHKIPSVLSCFIPKRVFLVCIFTSVGKESILGYLSRGK